MSWEWPRRHANRIGQGVMHEWKGRTVREGIEWRNAGWKWGGGRGRGRGIGGGEEEEEEEEDEEGVVMDTG